MSKICVVIKPYRKIKFSQINKNSFFIVRGTLYKEPQIWMKINKNRAMDIKNNIYIVKFPQDEIIEQISIDSIVEV